jgi:hypothetical protein
MVYEYTYDEEDGNGFLRKNRRFPGCLAEEAGQLGEDGGESTQNF